MKSCFVSKDTCCSGAVRLDKSMQHREQDEAEPRQPVESVVHAGLDVKVRAQRLLADRRKPLKYSRNQ